MANFYRDHTEIYERIFPFREEVHQFLNGYLPAGGHRVLDVGCGPGHYAGRFAQDGLDAVGIDLDPEMVRVAAERHPNATFHVMDMKAVGTLAGSFHLAFCLGNAAAHLDRNAFGDVVDGIASVLEPGGGWIVQTVNWDYLLNTGRYDFPVKRLDDGGLEFHRAYHDVSEHEVRFATKLVANGATVYEGDSVLHPVRAQTYVELHEARGFRLEGLFADYRSTPFDPDVQSGAVLVFHR
jgi:SAM-dependent methyltransferase